MVWLKENGIRLIQEPISHITVYIKYSVIVCCGDLCRPVLSTPETIKDEVRVAKKKDLLAFSSAMKQCCYEWNPLCLCMCMRTHLDMSFYTL